MLHLWEGTPVGREGNCTELQFCSLLSRAAGKDEAATSWLAREEARGASSQGRRLPERPRSARRRSPAQREASQLTAWPGVEGTAVSAGWRRVGEGWSYPGTPGVFGPTGSWARSGPRVARKPPHATQSFAPAAGRRGDGPGGSSSSSSSNSSSSVGGTLVRHEVTAAHTRSLFCSLWLFLTPLALIVAIPIVRNNSSCVAAQQESRAGFSFPLFPESLHPIARLTGMETRSARVAAACKPQPLTPAQCAPLFGDTPCPASAAYKVESRGLSPSPTPSAPRERAPHFACRVRNSPSAPTQGRPASPQEIWASLQGLYPELLAKLLAAPVLGALAMSWTALLSFSGLEVALGFC
ncbi:uncharacterized protein LOC119535440 [Choloepus didactylus]|uniref:uncharacterized protein LOC119535440 n=1 Tax=Choloepus didactylus TaxID=27675 RepID=UPI0018A1010C|nr:uncharacterized protein LOC119535440 [Choloepus didactylus]